MLRQKFAHSVIALTVFFAAATGLDIRANEMPGGCADKQFSLLADQYGDNYNVLMLQDGVKNGYLVFTNPDLFPHPIAIGADKTLYYGATVFQREIDLSTSQFSIDKDGRVKRHSRFSKESQPNKEQIQRARNQAEQIMQAFCEGKGNAAQTPSPS